MTEERMEIIDTIISTPECYEWMRKEWEVFRAVLYFFATTWNEEKKAKLREIINKCPWVIKAKKEADRKIIKKMQEEMRYVQGDEKYWIIKLAESADWKDMLCIVAKYYEDYERDRRRYKWWEQLRKSQHPYAFAWIMKNLKQREF